MKLGAYEVWNKCKIKTPQTNDVYFVNLIY